MTISMNLGKARTHSRSLAVLFTLSAALATFHSSTAQTSPQAPPILKLQDRAATDAVRGKYPPEMVVQGQASFDGAFVESVAFESGDKQYRVQIWESGPGMLQTDGYPYDEYCLVLDGQLEVTNRSGGTDVFGPGDSFVIPKGWQGTWNMKTRFKKQYIALVPASALSAN